jgi:hypothetical protein
MEYWDFMLWVQVGMIVKLKCMGRKAVAKLRPLIYENQLQVIQLQFDLKRHNLSYWLNFDFGYIIIP